MKKALLTIISSIFLFSCSQETVNQNLILQDTVASNVEAQAAKEKNGLVSYQGFVTKDSKGGLYLGINRKLLGIPLDNKENDEFHQIYQIYREYKNKEGYNHTQVNFGDARFGKNGKLYYEGRDIQSGKDEFLEIGTYKATLPLKENATVKISLLKGLTFKTSNTIQLGGGHVTEGPYIKAEIAFETLVRNITKKDLY